MESTKTPNFIVKVDCSSKTICSGLIFISTITLIPGMYDVPRPFRSEAVIQAEFYHQCRLIGLPCTLEWGSALGRMDLVVFNRQWTHVLAIVETKRWYTPNPSSRQIARYKKSGAPVFGLADPLRAEKLAKQIKRQYFDTNSEGVSVESILAIPKNDYRNRRALKEAFSPMNLCEEVNYRE